MLVENDCVLIIVIMTVNMLLWIPGSVTLAS